MIFNDDYDAALWYIMKADKENRKDLANFIKELPEELIKNIRIAIEKGKNEQPDLLKMIKNGRKAVDPDFDEDFYWATSKDDPNIKYYFEIDNFLDKALTITKTNGEEDLFELMIYPFKIEYAKYMDCFSEEWIGTLTNNIKTTKVSSDAQIIACDEHEYNMYKTPIGHFVSYPHMLKKHGISIPVFRYVNIRKFKGDLDKNNILSKRLKKTRKN